MNKLKSLVDGSMKKEMILNNSWKMISDDVLEKSYFKIMGIVDDWVVMRRKRCAPTLAHINDFGEGKQYHKVGKI